MSIKKSLIPLHWQNKSHHEVLGTSLWDTFQIDAGQACSIRFQAFTHPIGSSGHDGFVLKDIADTNMALGNMLPRGQEFLVEGVEVSAPYASALDRLRLFTRGSVMVQIGCKSYNRWPIEDFLVLRQQVFPELLIESERNFMVEVNLVHVEALDQHVRLRVALHGMLLRPYV